MQARKEKDDICAHDWRTTIADGVDMAYEQCRSDVTPDERHVMWALLKEAAETSRLAYPAPPRTGYPRKSAMPDAPDDVSQWALMMAYIQGQLEDAPAAEPTPPMPSAKQISRAEVVLVVWHQYALARKGDRSRIKRAVWLKAAGVPERKIRAVTGITKQAIHRAKDEAMRDMWDVIRRC